MSLARSIRFVATRILCTLVLLAAVPGGSALADTYTVLNLNDSGGGSLRAAVAAANANLGGDTIQFAAGLNGTILLSSPIDVTGDASLLILGDDRIEINGQAQTRLFTIQLDDAAFNRNVTLNQMTLRNGLSNGGGAIYVAGWNATLVLQETDVYDSSAIAGPDAVGGAILARYGGNVTVQSSVLRGNQASLHGGAIAADTVFSTGPNFPGSITVQNSLLEDNTALTGNGGAVYIDGDVYPGWADDSRLPAFRELTIEDSRLRRNSAGHGRHADGSIQPTVILADSARGSAVYVHGRGIPAQRMENVPNSVDNSSTIGKGGYKLSISPT